jgi:hypothetical protein
MATTLVAGMRDLTRAESRRAMRAVALLLAAAPIALALLRVVPNAVALGRASAAGPEQVALAQSILRDHVLCLISILGFIAVRFALAARP